MAVVDRISISRLVRGWLDSLEVGALNELADARRFLHTESSPYTLNRVKYAEYQLASIRKCRAAIPKAWDKATVTEPPP